MLKQKERKEEIDQINEIKESNILRRRLDIMLCFRLLYVIVPTSNVYDACVCVCVCVCARACVRACVRVCSSFVLFSATVQVQHEKAP